MTDNEIIKALDSLHKRILRSNFAREVTENEVMAIVDALSLINRQKAEIERLGEKNKRLFAENVSITHSSKEIKAEAIKEFAERLKGRFDQYDVELFCHSVIDNLVEEMVGDDK